MIRNKVQECGEDRRVVGKHTDNKQMAKGSSLNRPEEEKFEKREELYTINTTRKKNNDNQKEIKVEEQDDS